MKKWLPLLTRAIVCYILLVASIQIVWAEVEPQPQESDVDFQDIKSDDNVAGTADDSNKKPPVGDVGFLHAFVAAFSVIIVSELGDKTFFIAAIMAMKHPRVTVFAGAIGALTLMTVLSALFGQLATLIPRVYTYYISTALFAFFGLKMLKEGYYMKDSDAQEELEEVQSDLKKREDQLYESETVERKMHLIHIPDTPNNAIANLIHNSSSTNNVSNGEVVAAIPSTSSMPSLHSASSGAKVKRQKIENNNSESVIEMTRLNSDDNQDQRLDKEQRTELLGDAEKGVTTVRSKPSASKVMFRIFMQAFTMTFLAEWGDRSQLATIILAARDNVYGVMIGGTLGHAICTGLAVIGGRMIAQKISVRTVTIIGGVVFLIFAVSSLFFDPNEEPPANL